MIGDIDLFAQARPLSPHQVVGITGTNGKSTPPRSSTTSADRGPPSHHGGNIGSPISASSRWRKAASTCSSSRTTERPRKASTRRFVLLTSAPTISTATTASAIMPSRRRAVRYAVAEHVASSPPRTIIAGPSRQSAAKAMSSRNRERQVALAGAEGQHKPRTSPRRGRREALARRGAIAPALYLPACRTGWRGRREETGAFANDTRRPNRTPRTGALRLTLRFTGYGAGCQVRDLEPASRPRSCPRATRSARPPVFAGCVGRRGRSEGEMLFDAVNEAAERRAGGVVWSALAGLRLFDQFRIKRGAMLPRGGGAL